MLNIDVENIEEIVILHMEGVMSADSLKNADSVFTEQLKAVPELIALNCKNLSHIDSYGINRLFKLSRECASNGIKILAFNLHEQIFALFDVTKLNHLISITSEEQFKRDYII